VKHTYLYPLEDGELPLWRMARTGATDLFNSPDGDPPSPMWEHFTRLSDALGEARGELHKRLESRDRICIGRHYVIPGSFCEVARSREREADDVVRLITRDLWEAPYFRTPLCRDVLSLLKGTAGQGGRDDWAAIRAFCSKYHVTKENGRRFRVVPVWM